MNETLSWFSAILYKDFVLYTKDQLRELGLSYGALPFLLYVGKHPGCTPTELTRAIHMDGGHTQRTIARLREGGFVSNEKSGRTHYLHLTAAGEEAFVASHRVFGEWDAQRLAGLTEEERGQLMALLGKVKKGVKAHE